MPTRVTGYDKDTGKWDEMSQTINVSRTGVRVRLRHRLQLGHVVQLMLPLPMKLRSHGFYDSTYKVYAIVRRIEPVRVSDHASFADAGVTVGGTFTGAGETMTEEQAKQWDGKAGEPLAR